MTTVTGLAIVALFFGGTSLALAQNAPNVTTGPNGAPAYTSGQTAKTGQAIKHHKKLYMSTKGSRHKTLKTSKQPSKQPMQKQ